MFPESNLKRELDSLRSDLVAPNAALLHSEVERRKRVRRRSKVSGVFAAVVLAGVISGWNLNGGTQQIVMSEAVTTSSTSTTTVDNVLAPSTSIGQDMPASSSSTPSDRPLQVRLECEGNVVSSTVAEQAIPEFGGPPLPPVPSAQMAFDSYRSSVDRSDWNDLEQAEVVELRQDHTRADYVDANGRTYLILEALFRDTGRWEISQVQSCEEG